MENINEQCCCFNLRKVTRAVTQLFDQQLEPIGIRSTQFTVLVALAAKKSKTLTEVSNNLVMDRTTLTRNLKPLIAMGLILSQNQHDKRSKAYILTDLGQEKLTLGLPLWQIAQNILLREYGVENYYILINNLERLQKIATNYR